MSGHSKWSTIKRQKGLNDSARGQLFSKLSKAISIAAKEGGGDDPSSNYKLRLAVDAARAANMPKDNIERAISRAKTDAANLESITYEGFGPSKIAVIVETLTDNRNRTGQEMRNLFERNGGTMGVPGSVSFQFEPKGYLHIAKATDPSAQMLALIDLGVEDIEESEDGIDMYVEPHELSEMSKKVEQSGYPILESALIRKPTTFADVSEDAKERVHAFLETVEEHDDVQRVFANINF